MPSRRAVLLNLSLLLFLPACQPAETPAPSASESKMPAVDETSEVKAAFRTLLKAYQVGDVEAVKSVLDHGVIWMPPDAAAVEGVETVVNYHREAFGAANLELTFSVQEVVPSADWAFVRGKYMLSAAPKTGGNPSAEAGKAVVVMKRSPEGAWKFYRFIWNRDFRPEAQ